MPPASDPAQLRDDALAIWQAGVDAVNSRNLVASAIQWDDESDTLHIAGRPFPRGEWDRIIVVGAGKAGAGMAAGVEQSVAGRAPLDGWVNVPADCVDATLQHIHLHPARPAGLNEPTDAGIAGARRIVEIVAGLSARDICICLISGGGSALLPLPVSGVTLHDKQALTRHLSAHGANIAELNTVRKQLSGIKGGGLARQCRAGHLITLVISDVIGDPLDLIASGPTVADSSTPADALRVLEQYDAASSGASPQVWQWLRQESAPMDDTQSQRTLQKLETVIGNNEVAVNAAASEAKRRGYRVRAEPATELEGDASEVGEQLADRALRMRSGDVEYDCLISGGEPTVELAPAEVRGRGGRNQHLVAAALQRWTELSVSLEGLALLSGGTDGEDGPTDAAGAWISELLPNFPPASLADSLQRSDTYSFFQRLNALIQTGPTHTNVCDLRVALVSKRS